MNWRKDPITLKKVLIFKKAFEFVQRLFLL